MARIGIIGSGNIARRLVARFAETVEHELAFVHARSRDGLPDLGPAYWLDSLADLSARQPDLVIEAAHPVYLEQWGEQILRHAALMPLSASALADDGLRDKLLASAQANGTALYLSRGALVGVDVLSSARWDSVSVEFVKNPEHIDFEAAPEFAEGGARRVIYEGPARGIAGLFPRNVNAMVVLALATVGLDDLHCRLIGDPSIATAELHIDARREDGHRITVSKTEPMVGVSGEYLFDALLQAIRRVTPSRDALQFV